MSSTHGNNRKNATTSGTHSIASRLSQHNVNNNKYDQYSPRSSNGPNIAFARQYVGELMQRVNFE